MKLLITGKKPRATSFPKTRTKTNQVHISSVNSGSSLYYFLVWDVPTPLRKGPAGLDKIPIFSKKIGGGFSLVWNKVKDNTPNRSHYQDCVNCDDCCLSALSPGQNSTTVLGPRLGLNYVYIKYTYCPFLVSQMTKT